MPICSDCKFCRDKGVTTGKCKKKAPDRNFSWGGGGGHTENGWPDVPLDGEPCGDYEAE